MKTFKATATGYDGSMENQLANEVSRQGTVGYANISTNRPNLHRSFCTSITSAEHYAPHFDKKIPEDFDDRPGLHGLKNFQGKFSGTFNVIKVHHVPDNSKQNVSEPALVCVIAQGTRMLANKKPGNPVTLVHYTNDKLLVTARPEIDLSGSGTDTGWDELEAMFGGSE